MDYKELANLIFPDAKSVEYFEEKYPERNLPEGAEVTRFAPSPTGFVHIGGLFGGLVDMKIARQTGGVFILRIEDTDQKRGIENGAAQIVEALNEFKIIPDEGATGENTEKGNYGPYKQSNRRAMYHAFAKRLIEEGRAYPCFASTEELDEMRAKQEAAGVKTGYYGVWAKYRNLSVDEAAEKIRNGEKYIIRFKSMGNPERKIKFHDEIKGKLVFPENDQDAVIIKADGLPTYHFAHVVDDHLMRITLIIRGDEWLASLPLHLEMFKALNLQTPKFAHTAAMQKEENGKKRKISKRKDPEAAVSYYAEIGVPNEAVKEYLLNIANSNFEIWRKQNPEKTIDDFDFNVNKMSVSGALFDMVKLLDIGKNVISKYTAEQVYAEAYEWTEKHDNELLELLNNKEYSIRVLNIERGKAKPRRDIAKWSDVKECIEYMYDEKFFDSNLDYEFDKISDKEEINKILRLYIEKYYDENDDQQTWFGKIKDLADELGYAREVKEYKKEPEKWPGHVGDISTVLRVAITRRKNTPDLYEIMQVLGRESIEKRINLLIK